MGYTTFSTEQADYVLDLAIHVPSPKKQEVFSGADAFVLEWGGDKEAAIGGHTVLNTALVNMCRKEQIPMYVVDPGVKKWYTLKEVFREVFTSFPVSPEVAYQLVRGFSSKRLDEGFLDEIAEMSRVRGTAVNEGRNAIAARSIEEYIVPKITEKKGRRPKIAIHYGIAHAGIKHNLMDKARRDAVIDREEHRGTVPFAAYKAGSLNEVVTFYQEGETWGWRWNYKTERTGLFNDPQPESWWVAVQKFFMPHESI